MDNETEEIQCTCGHRLKDASYLFQDAKPVPPQAGQSPESLQILHT